MPVSDKLSVTRSAGLLLSRAACAAVFAASLSAFAADSGPGEFFEMKVRPVLAKNCFACHTASKMGGLEMSGRESVLKGGKSGAAVVPGKPDESLLVKAIRYSDDKLKMPPQGKLADSEVDAISTWIRSGAIWPEGPKATPGAAKGYVIRPEQRAYWAYQPVRKPASPAVKDARWTKSALDAFVLAKLEEKGLRPTAPASKRTLIRRVTYDLTGLPPTPEEVDVFLADRSPAALEKVVDRLLASPRYGERWGRIWLDVARYSDDKLNSTNDDPYPNAFRYRDWVIDAINRDMPYDRFVKAQIAGDLMPEQDRKEMVGGLGFYALSPEFQEDRVDVTGRAFLAMTVGCAQCHDHKFDPIPTKDYYALLGVFKSSRIDEYPLAPEETVKEFKQKKKLVDDQKKEIADFLKEQSLQLAGIFASRSADYLMAAAKLLSKEKTGLFDAARAAALDPETLERWVRLLKVENKDQDFLKRFESLLAKGAKEAELRAAATDFQAKALAVLAEKKEIDRQNMIRLGGKDDRELLAGADLLSLSREKFILWRDLYSDGRIGEPYKLESGILYYGPQGVERFLSGEWSQHLRRMRAALEKFEKDLPQQYPYFHVMAEAEKPANEKIHIRGSETNLGDEAPRAFLSVLCDGPPKAFQRGSGRAELAESIASPSNPLTARVIANRIWQNHFGAGIVPTPSNFGLLGEKPTNPELLDYLAARLMEQKWSMKALHREILLSATYALGTAKIDRNVTADPDNKLLWRANRQRLGVEALRDSVLFASGSLDLTAGGPPARLTEDGNVRRTVYGFVSRRRLDGTLSLFDFPNPNSTSDRRIATNTPVQRLFFLNSGFLLRESEKFAARLRREAGEETAARIRRAYRILYQRDATAEEISAANEFLAAAGGAKKAWPAYAQVLLSSNEFIFLN